MYNEYGEPFTKGFAKAGKVNLIIDGQFGSTGKGLIASKLACDDSFDICAASLSPNAGHTFYYSGKQYVTKLLPVAGIINNNAIIYLSAESVIDEDLLLKEIEEFSIFDIDRRLCIHPRAALITKENKEKDKELLKIASTTSGTGAARADKILRNNPLISSSEKLEEFVLDTNTPFNLEDVLNKGAKVIMESGQGVDLGLSFGYSYPYCTSRDVLTSNLLADLGLHPKYLGNVCMTFRTYPIRVGNIKDGDTIIGYSGPYYDDSKELSWNDLGQIPELTTVTKRIRRVFSWSYKQYERSLRLVKPTHIFLNFINYIKEEDIDIFRFQKHRKPTWMGYGPTPSEVLPFSYSFIENLVYKWN